MPEDMIDKYGRVRVHSVVSSFYSAVLRSEHLATYFEGVDVHGLMQHQTAFMAAVMGGPARHSPQDIATAHQGPGIHPEDFEEMIGLLRASLERLEFDPGDIDVIANRYYDYKQSVVSPG